MISETMKIFLEFYIITYLKISDAPKFDVWLFIWSEIKTKPCSKAEMCV